MNNGYRESMSLKFIAALLVLIFMPVLNMRAQDRLPPIPPEKMSEAQKKAVTDYKDLRKTDSRRTAMVGHPASPGLVGSRLADALACG